MFLPIGDDNSDRHLTPFINYLLVVGNILVFIFLQGLGSDLNFTFAYATVPAEILTGTDIITGPQVEEDPFGRRIEVPGLQPTPGSVYFTLLTSMFMHGGLAHLGGNMLYLWIFGDNLENAMGHGRYLVFYLLCGILASLSHVFSTAYFGQNEMIPSLGASGAISGVLGGYMLVYPARAIHVWVLFGIMSVPAFLAVGLWFVFQVVNGMGALGGEEAGGVAYAAHIGGFIAGMLLVKFFVRPEYLTRRRRTY
ncbi:MAG TPA: rhomboid family intramembrane serine protease [Chitinophagaceae bacterium]